MEQTLSLGETRWPGALGYSTDGHADSGSSLLWNVPPKQRGIYKTMLSCLKCTSSLIYTLGACISKRMPFIFGCGGMLSSA